MYARNAFDVLCITDHVVRSDDPWCAREGVEFNSLDEGSGARISPRSRAKASRAWATYGMPVFPGLELTYIDDDPAKAAHVVAVGLREFVSVDCGIAEAMGTSAAEAGAALVAAHPFDREPALASGRFTRRFAHDTDLCRLAHRFELFNRTSSSPGSPRPACRRSRPATSTAASTSSSGRPCSRAVTTSVRSSSTSARLAPAYLVRIDESTEKLALTRVRAGRR